MENWMLRKPMCGEKENEKSKVILDNVVGDKKVESIEDCRTKVEMGLHSLEIEERRKNTHSDKGTERENGNSSQQTNTSQKQDTYSQNGNRKEQDENTQPEDENEGKSQPDKRRKEQESVAAEIECNSSDLAVSNVEECDKTSEGGNVREVACEGLKCFVRRSEGLSVGLKGAPKATKETAKWCAPPKNIFNPTLEVRVVTTLYFVSIYI